MFQLWFKHFLHAIKGFLKAILALVLVLLLLIVFIIILLLEIVQLLTFFKIDLGIISPFLILLNHVRESLAWCLNPGRVYGEN